MLFKWHDGNQSEIQTQRRALNEQKKRTNVLSRPHFCWLSVRLCGDLGFVWCIDYGRCCEILRLSMPRTSLTCYVSVTNPMEQSHFWKANSCSSSLSMEPNYCVYKNCPCILSHINLIQSTPYFPEIHRNIYPSIAPKYHEYLFPSYFSDKNNVFFSSHWYCMPRPFHRLWLLSMCLIKHQAIKAHWSGGIAPPLLTSAVDGGEWSPSRPGRFTP
jgi:hypothetical protein